MKRRRYIPLVLSTLALLAALGMWSRSYWRLDLLWRVHDDGTTAAIVSYQGALHFIASGTNGRTRPVQWDVYRIPDGATYAALHRVGSILWEHFGFARVKTTPTIAVATTRVIGPGVTIVIPPVITLPYGPSAVGELTPWLAGSSYDAVIIPWWAVALVASLHPLLRGSRVIRSTIRRRQGRCPACGYDLRASPERCPECGRTPR